MADDYKFDEKGLHSLEDYWIAALLPEVEAVWGEHPVFKAEKSELCYSAFLTAYYDKTEHDIRTRREIQKAFLSGAETKSGWFNTDTLRKHGKVMPTRSFVPKVIGNLCDVLFNKPPMRIWTGDDTKDAVWATAYKEARADQKLLQAYRLATLGNVCAVRPYNNKRGRKRFQVLPRDMFRVKSADGEEVEELWVPHSTTQRNGKRRTVFQVWTDDRMWYADYRGEQIRNPFVGEETERNDANKYGRIPFAFLRLEDPVNADFYGGGWHDLASIQVFNNTMQLAETRNAVFNAFQFLVAINMEMNKNRVIIAPDELLELNDIEAGGNQETGGRLPPQLDTVSLEGSYKTAQEWRIANVREFMSNEGIPRHFYEEFVTPASGIALQVMEREPARRRRGHRLPLVGFEADLAEVSAVVWNVDRQAPAIGLERLDERLTAFSVDYPEEPLYLEPAAQYALDKEMAADGVMYPSTFLARYSGNDKPFTDEQAVVEMQRNKTLWNGISPTEPPDAPIVPDGDQGNEEM